MSEERTLTSHISAFAYRATMMFALLGGGAGVIVGVTQAWMHLNWFLALVTTLVIASLIFAVGCHVADMDQEWAKHEAARNR